MVRFLVCQKIILICGVFRIEHLRKSFSCSDSCFSCVFDVVIRNSYLYLNMIRKSRGDHFTSYYFIKFSINLFPNTPFNRVQKISKDNRLEGKYSDVLIYLVIKAVKAKGIARYFSKILHTCKVTKREIFY